MGANFIINHPRKVLGEHVSSTRYLKLLGISMIQIMQAFDMLQEHPIVSL
ncbi:hypothetical protein PENSUB_13646 [Penicillium subrubescens]|uniref:Uncharacterized protein n=1 Tax=Penicillium subrubescens TaxID=1316194 RepID=A0A1Q5SNP1_9EURO|nr:hypothetical protein PENSUB_13646 [Penicillium subrubescens]